jgi:hypothetical protein
MFSGLNRNILTFYPYPEDTFHISDQDHYKFDMKIHGRPHPESEYYDISASTPHGINESKDYSNDYQNFTTIAFDNPSITDQDDQQMVYHMQAGYPWTYFTTWNTYPYIVPDRLTIFHSQNDASSLLMGNIAQFRSLPDQPGYRWETALWNVIKGDSLNFFKATNEKIATIKTDDFDYKLGKSLLKYNLSSNNTDTKIVVSDAPGRGAFNRHYGERESGTISYQLYSGETILKKGTFKNRMNDDYGGIIDTEASQQAYKLILNYDDYQVGGKFGKATVTLEFNTSKADKNSPLLSLLSLEANGISTSEVTIEETPVLKFRINDLCQNSYLYGSQCQSSGIQSTWLKIKKINEENWTDLTLESVDNEEFSADIPPHLVEGYYSLLLISTDNENNKLTYELNPAFLVGNATQAVPYAVVTLVSPKDRDINAGKNPEFRWNPIDGANGYTIQISKNQDFSEFATNTEVGLTTTYSLPNPLPDESDYYWRVKGNFTSASIPWSETYTFFSGKLPQALLLEPLHSSTDNPLSIKFKWERPANSSWQTFELSNTEDFSSIVNYSGLTGDTITVSNLAPESKYYWRVTSRFFTFYDTYNIQSEVFSFTTLELPAATLAEPSNNATNQSLGIKFAWERAPNSSWQIFELSKSQDFTSVLYSSVLTDDTIRVSNLKPGTQYFWRVSSTFNDTYQSISEVFNFKTQELPTATLVEPLNNTLSHPLSVKFKWIIPGNVSKLKFELSKTSNFNTVAYATELSKDTVTVNNLLAGTTYYWRLTTSIYTIEGHHATHSDVFHFKTLEMAAASLREPNNNTSDHPLSVKLKWIPHTNSVQNRLEISEENNFSSILFTTNLNTDTITVKNLLPDTKYYWRVGCTFISGDKSYYKLSNIFNFKTFQLTTATLLEPLNNTTAHPLNIKFMWEGPSNSLQQQLELSNSMDFSTSTFHTAAQEETITLDNLLPGTDYYWRVRATFQDFYYTTSEVFNFKTAELTTSIVTEAGKFFLNCYPNPFHDKINISFISEGRGELELIVRDVLGREAWKIEGIAHSGNNVLVWDGKNAQHEHLTDGVYLGALRINSETTYFRILKK